jgi:predicted alpha/beta-hydrolase family hydrolase
VLVEIPTESGPARLHVAPADGARALLWLGHGAGGGVAAPDLTALAAGLPARGITVVRYEQPWHVRGGRVAPRPPALDAAWLESADAVHQLAAGAPLLVGGRSAGARVACRTAATVGATAVVCLAFPLHPPSRPDRSRLEELRTPTVPVLVLQGERDTFGSAQQLQLEVGDRAGIRVVAIPGADHSMKVLKGSPVPPREVAALLVATIGDFVDEVLA